LTTPARSPGVNRGLVRRERVRARHFPSLRRGPPSRDGRAALFRVTINPGPRRPPAPAGDRRARHPKGPRSWR
jgi:hypothetical protein